jgi:hypothetical protein
MNGSAQTVDRGPLVARALRHEYLPVGWIVVAGVIAIAAAPAPRAPRARLPGC